MKQMKQGAVAPVPMSTKKLKTLTCPRCGFNHQDIFFHPITNPSGTSTHFALCPKTKEPILACFKQAASQVACPAVLSGEALAKTEASGEVGLPASERQQASVTDPAALTDLSPMPWGKFKDVPMQDVPANYLHHFWTAGDPPLSQDKRSPVAAYIRRNLEVLKQEYTDGIW